MTLVIVLGIFIGAIMGLTGAGGGILAVPVIVAGMHWTMQQAAPVALIAVAAGAAVGAIDGFKHGLVRYKAAMLMAICGVPITRLGQQWAHVLPQFVLMGGFALLMLAVSWRFYKESQQTHLTSKEDALRLAFISSATGKFIWSPIAALILAGIGMMTGLMTGLLGVNRTGDAANLVGLHGVGETGAAVADADEVKSLRDEITGEIEANPVSSSVSYLLIWVLLAHHPNKTRIGSTYSACVH